MFFWICSYLNIRTIYCQNRKIIIKAGKQLCRKTVEYVFEGIWFYLFSLLYEGRGRWCIYFSFTRKILVGIKTIILHMVSDIFNLRH